MKTLKFKAVHRLLLTSILNDAGKNTTLSELRKLLDLLKVVELREDEKLELGIKVEADRVVWNQEKDVEKDVDMEDAQFESLKEIIKKKTEEKVFSFETLSPMVYIAEQFGVEV